MLQLSDKKGFLLIFMLLLVFYFIMAPSPNWINVLLGIGSALGITLYWSSELFQPEQPVRFNAKQLWQMLIYLLHLAYNVVTANISVAKIVLKRDMPISPGFILLQTKLNQNLTRVLYANSITLTPGTITINLDDDRLLVHAITSDAACDVSTWYMEDKLAQIEESGQ